MKVVLETCLEMVCNVGGVAISKEFPECLDSNGRRRWFDVLGLVLRLNWRRILYERRVRDGCWYRDCYWGWRVVVRFNDGWR